MSPRFVVVGPPGAGKTTVSELLAARLGLPFRDVDADIVELAGKPISDIFTDDGEPVFRAMEEEAVAKALVEHEGVLALGGGAVLSAVTRERLREHTVVFLNVGMAEGVRRTGLSSRAAAAVRGEPAGDVQDAAGRAAAAVPRGRDDRGRRPTRWTRSRWPTR